MSKAIKIAVGVIAITVLLFGVSLAVFEGFRNGLVQTFQGIVKNTMSIGHTEPSSSPTQNGLGTEEYTDPSVQDSEVILDEYREPDNLMITVFETSGNAILLEAGGYAVLLDGSDGTDSDKLLQRLKATGVTKLRYLVATNYLDSSAGGVTKIMSSISSDYVLLSPSLLVEEKNKSIREYLNSQKLIYNSPETQVKYKLTDDVYFEVIPTHQNGSLAVIVYNKNSKIAITGDITRVDDEALSYVPVDVDTYIISARNKNYTPPKKFLARINPKTVVIAGGTEQDFTSIQQAISSGNLSYYRTAKKGDMLIGSNGVDLLYTYAEDKAKAEAEKEQTDEVKEDSEIELEDGAEVN